MRTTKETRELIGAIALILARKAKMDQDGKQTLREKLGFVKDVPEAWDAVMDAGEIPSELADLDKNERIILIGDVRQIMIALGMSHRQSDIAEWIFEESYHTIERWVSLFSRIKTAPPTALPA